MSDLREALEKLVGEAWDDGNAVGLDGYVGPNRGAGDVDPEAERRRGQLLDRASETLAAHPAEPAIADQMEILAEAFEAQVMDAFQSHSDLMGGLLAVYAFGKDHAALLGPRPLLDRESVEEAIATNAWPAEAADAVMKLARPMPTHEQIARTLRERLVKSNFNGDLHEPLRTQVIEQWVDVLTGSVSGLLNGTES